MLENTSVRVYCNEDMTAHTYTLLNAKKASKAGFEFLLSTLKDHASEPGIKRVDEILSLLVVAEGYRREQLDYLDRTHPDRIVGGISGFLDLVRRSKESERAYHQTLELLNKKLSRYRWAAEITGDIDGFRSELHPVGSSKGEWELVEPFMVAALLRVMDKPGEISRFCRCSDCHQWFYAARGHQHFCGDVCRRRHEAQNPAFKEKRRVYMRERYRPLQRQLEERSVTIANRTNQTKGGK